MANLSKTRRWWLFGVVGLAVGLGLLVSGPVAWAHETRDLVGGKYQVRVGFLQEPTYQGLENGLELTICTGPCTTKTDGSGLLANGLNGAFDTLKVEVIFGSQTMPLTLGVVPRQPGRYQARFVPTRAGDYTFHIFGLLGPDKDKLDERFTSGPNSFDSVQTLAEAQFPDKPGFGSISVASSPAVTTPVPVPVTANVVATIGPSVAAMANGPLALPTGGTASNSNPGSGELQELRQQLGQQQRQLDDAKAQTTGASILGAVGIGIGAVGLGIAFTVLWMSRRVKADGREPEGG